MKGKKYLLGESSEEPDEWLFELIVGLGRDVVVLEVLLSVEGDLLGLDLSVLDINLVSDEHDWDVLAHSDKILVPLWNVLVGNSGADIEHDDTALSSNIVSISEPSEFLLTGGIPHVEQNLSLGSEEWHWVHLDSESSNVLLLELSGKMSLDESGFTDTSISDEDELEFSNWALSLHSVCLFV